MRASATQRVFDWKAIQKYRSSVIGENVARFNLKDARDLVVLATGNAYLQAIAGAARVETAQAQVETAKALYDKAVAQQQAGVAPAIDTLRAQVEYQTRQQQLIAATNDFAKQKISLARVIGLAPGQEFELADKAPYEAFPIPDLETSLQRAYSLRSDYKAARDRLVAAQLERSAATAGYFPTVDMAVNFGEIGAVPGDVLPTYAVVGTLNIPIFQGGKVHGDVLKAEASLRQAQAQMADVRAQIDQDIRNALLDLKSSERSGGSRPEFGESCRAGAHPIAGPFLRRSHRQSGSGAGAGSGGGGAREFDFEPLSSQSRQGFFCPRPGTRRRGRSRILEREVDYGTNQQRCSRAQTATGSARAAVPTPPSQPRRTANPAISGEPRS